jgi:hypothetical protein
LSPIGLGSRPPEAYLKLRWSDADFAKRLVHVRRSYAGGELGVPKSGCVRSVPMDDDVARVLDGLNRRERFTGEDDLVFPNEVGGFLDDSKIRKRYRAALDRAKLKPLRFHDLRHSFGTLAVQVFPLSDVMAYMGHADISTTMIYIHHVPAADAAERLTSGATPWPPCRRWRRWRPASAVSGRWTSTARAALLARARPSRSEISPGATPSSSSGTRTDGRVGAVLDRQLVFRLERTALPVRMAFAATITERVFG